LRCSYPAYIIKARESVKPGQFHDFLAVAKGKKNYPYQTIKGPWYILTNLGSLTVAIQAYKRRMEIEEMFRDCKSGGYNLEGSGLRGERLN
jgi:hypothetical protein